jgi:hypothetical protein
LFRSFICKCNSRICKLVGGGGNFSNVVGLIKKVI